MTDFKPGDRVAGRERNSELEYTGDWINTRECYACNGLVAVIKEDSGLYQHLYLESVRLISNPFDPKSDPDTSSDSAIGDTPREKILAEAAALVTGDRNSTYGAPTGNFRDTAAIWNVYLNHKLAEGRALTAGDVAAMMVGLKLARIKASPKKDNWADIAGYAACGYECDVNTGIIQEES